MREREVDATEDLEMVEDELEIWDRVKARGMLSRRERDDGNGEGVGELVAKLMVFDAEVRIERGWW